VVTVVLLIVAVEAIRSIIKNPNFKWHVVGQFFTTNAVLKGLLVTLELTVLAMVLGITIGVILAVMRPSRMSTSWPAPSACPPARQSR